MKLIVVRHGLSEANVADIVGTDSELAPKGKQQAKDLAERLANIKIDTIYSSPFKRARDTAQPVADDQEVEVQIDERIREIDWGDFDGQSSAFFEKTIGNSPRDKLSSYDFNFHKYHGEDVADVEKRIRSFVDDIKSKPYKTALVVCHGGPVRMFNYVITGKKIPYQPNAQELHFEI